tara:strand:+ start:302 stop:424 length:123 start_codon:yes stop_codon:yes gene_type:complete
VVVQVAVVMVVQVLVLLVQQILGAVAVLVEVVLTLAVQAL